jgi:hypothetical protein
MEVKIKRGRIWLPNSKNLRGKFIEIYIENGPKQTSFIAVIPNDGRLHIPIGLRKQMNLIENVCISKIVILKNKERTKQIIKNDKMEILSMIPKRTLSGYEIIVTDKNEKYLCWFCSQGRPKEITIAKEAPLEISRFLGYYQAEGGKPKLRKRRGRTLSFTNTKLEIIEDFLKLSESIIDKNLWSLAIRYNPSISKEGVDKILEKMKCLGVCKEKIKMNPAERLRTYSLVLWISNSILSETVNNMNEKMKKILAEEGNEELFKNYFRGVFAGDGTFFSYRDKKGSLHSWSSIFEAKKNSINSFEKILKKWGLDGRIKKCKNKNLYVLRIINNWEKLLKLVQYDIFRQAPRHKEKLFWTIKNHKKYRALKYLIKLNKEFNQRDIKELSNKDSSYAAHWTQDREEEGIIKRVEKQKEERLWGLTEKGINYKTILGSIG